MAVIPWRLMETRRVLEVLRYISYSWAEKPTGTAVANSALSTAMIKTRHLLQI